MQRIRTALEVFYEEVRTEYDLTREQILSALKYASAHLADEEIRAFG